MNEKQKKTAGKLPPKPPINKKVEKGKIPPKPPKRKKK